MTVRARPALIGGLVLAAALVAIGALWLARGPAKIDGTNLEWSVAQFAASGNLDSITVLNGKLVMAGADDDGPAIWISQDGLGWGRSSVATRGAANQRADFLSMGFVSGHADQLIALGHRSVTHGTASSWEPALWTSDDGGKRWVDALDSSLPQGTLEVVPTADGYVALGQGPNGDPAVWKSQDGLEWRLVSTYATFGAATVEGMAVRHGRLVAVGADLGQAGPGAAMAWWSDDGVTWERVDLSAERAGNSVDVAATDEGFVAVGSVRDPAAAIAWRSTDGVTWHQVALNGGGGSLAALVAASADQFVAVGGGGSWERGPSPTRADLSILSLTGAAISLEQVNEVTGIVAYGDRYVGIGSVGCGLTGECLPYLIWGLPPGANANVRVDE
jgi:hypothetical protein